MLFSINRSFSPFSYTTRILKKFTSKIISDLSSKLSFMWLIHGISGCFGSSVIYILLTAIIVEWYTVWWPYYGHWMYILFIQYVTYCMFDFSFWFSFNVLTLFQVSFLIENYLITQTFGNNSSKLLYWLLKEVSAK